jgi:hypothetical protein
LPDLVAANGVEQIGMNMNNGGMFSPNMDLALIQNYFMDFRIKFELESWLKS